MALDGNDRLLDHYAVDRAERVHRTSHPDKTLAGCSYRIDLNGAEGAVADGGARASSRLRAPRTRDERCGECVTIHRPPDGVYVSRNARRLS